MVVSAHTQKRKKKLKKKKIVNQTCSECQEHTQKKKNANQTHSKCQAIDFNTFYGYCTPPPTKWIQAFYSRRPSLMTPAHTCTLAQHGTYPVCICHNLQVSLADRKHM